MTTYRLRGAVERVAGGEDDALRADVVDDVGFGRIDDVRLLDLVGERPVGNLEDHLVADLDVGDVAERREVGGAVAGDPDRLALSRQARVRVVAGPLLEVRLVGSLDEDEVDADARDLDPADALAVRGSCRRRSMQAGRPAGRRRCRSDDRDVGYRRVGEEVRLELIELVAGCGLFDAPVDRRERLLPGERDPGVGQDDQPAVIRATERIRAIRLMRPGSLRTGRRLVSPEALLVAVVKDCRVRERLSQAILRSPPTRPIPSGSGAFCCSTRVASTRA